MANIWDTIKNALTARAPVANNPLPSAPSSVMFSGGGYGGLSQSMSGGAPRLTQSSAGRAGAVSRPYVPGGPGMDYSAAQGMGQAPVSGSNYLQQLLAQYLSAAEAPDEGSIRAQLSSAAHAEFDPQIAALQAAMGQAKSRHKGAAKNVGGIYKNLKKYYEQSGVESAKRGKAQKSEAADRYAQLQAVINQQYAGSMDEQTKRLQELGLETSAGPGGAMDQQVADQNNAAAIARLIGGSEQAALNQQAAGDTNYWLEGAGIVGQQRGEALAGLQGQLMDYLNKTGTDIAGLTGQREASVSKGVVNAMGQAQKQRLEALKNAVGMGIDISKLQGGGTAKELKGLTGAAQYLGSDPAMAATFIDLLNEATVYGNTTKGKNEYGKYTRNKNGDQQFPGSVRYSPTEMARIVRNGALNKGLSPQQADEMYKAYMAYAGKL